MPANWTRIVPNSVTLVGSLTAAGLKFMNDVESTVSVSDIKSPWLEQANTVTLPQRSCLGSKASITRRVCCVVPEDRRFRKTTIPMQGLGQLS